MKKYLLLLYCSVFLILPKSQFAQWEIMYNNPDFLIGDVDFLNADTGFAAGYVNFNGVNPYSGFILKTIDGGNLWDTVYWNSPSEWCPLSFSFVNSTIGYAAGEGGKLFKTTNGGENWESFSIVTGSVGEIYNFKFITIDIGFGKQCRTTDGGYTWSDMGIGITRDYAFINDSTGWVAADGIFYTDDYGNTWEEKETNSDGPFTSISIASENIGFAIEYPSTIYKSTDGGESWYKSDSLLVEEICVIRFMDETTGYLLLNNSTMRIMKTNDSGYNWEYVFFGNGYSKSIQVLDEQNIFASTFNGKIYGNSTGQTIPIYPVYTEIEWASSLSSSTYPTTIESVSLDTETQLHLSGLFDDTLVVDNSYLILSEYPEKRSAYILSYPVSGSLPWYMILEAPNFDYFPKSSCVDEENNIIIELNLLPNKLKEIRKYSTSGSLIWMLNGYFENSIQDSKMLVDDNGNIHVCGLFKESFTFENITLTPAWSGIYYIVADSNGNLLEVKLLAECQNYSSLNFNFSRNSQGHKCISLLSPGPMYIGSDTLGHSEYHLICFDDEENLLWYNNEFNTEDTYISDIKFINNNHLLIIGGKENDDDEMKMIFDYDISGNKTDSVLISGDGFTTINKIFYTENDQLLAVGSFASRIISENDTLYGFGIHNSFVYLFDESLNLLYSTHIPGIRLPLAILKNQDQSYLVGTFDENIIFLNDTLIKTPTNKYVITKLESLITNTEIKDVIKTLNIHPNPSTGMVYIKSGINYKTGYVEVYDIAGKRVYTSFVSEKYNSVNLSVLEDGIYIIQSNLDGRIFTQKIIIQ